MGRARKLSPYRLGHRVEHAVGELGFARVEESVCHIDVFTDRDTHRDVGPGDQFVGAAAQDLQQRLVEPLKPPLLGQLASQDTIDFVAAGEGADDQVIEESDVGLGVLLVLDLAAEAMLVTGSSLTVMSGLRFVKRAAARGMPLVIVNRGQTRGDGLADLVLDEGCTPLLQALAHLLG